LHRLIGLHEDMAPFDIEVIRPKVKVRLITFVIKVFFLNILRTIYHRAFIFHMLIGPGKGLTPIDFVFREGLRSQGSLL